MFLISFSNSLDDVSVKQMQIYKSCHVDFGYNDTVCDNLVQDFKEQNEEVQNEVQGFLLYVKKIYSFCFFRYSKQK